ncbi:MAG: GldG family protein [Spirochaetota bacterium]
MRINIIDTLKNKNVRYGGYAALITFAVLSGIVILNLLIQSIPAELDITKNKLYSLSDQTKKVVNKLSEDVNIYGLYKVGQENEEVAVVLKKYTTLSKHIKLDYIDPDKNPTFINKYDKDKKGIREGSLIVESGKNFKVISPYDLYDISYGQTGNPQLMGFTVEQRLTSALLYVSSGYSPRIYELTGHQEYSFADFSLSDTLQKENYEIESINLITSPKVPDDAAILAVISPKFDITAAEEDKIIDYLENGGRALFLFDLVSFDPMPVFSNLLKSYGVGIETGVVMEGDTTRRLQADNPFFVTPALASHEIVNPLSSNDLNVIIPNAQGVAILAVRKRNVEVEPLLTTSKNSWIRTVDNGSIRKIDSDISGPVNLAVAVSKKKMESNEKEGFRIVVAGSARFLSPIPPFGTLKGNVEFLMNTLSWVNNRSETISIRSKSLFTLPLQMNAVSVFIYAGVVVILIPLIILVCGLVIWLKRRHL